MRVLGTLFVLGFAALSGAADLPGIGPDAGKTVIYRDTWGVPHIYAPTEEAGLYAEGWAQAEEAEAPPGPCRRGPWRRWRSP